MSIRRCIDGHHITYASLLVIINFVVRFYCWLSTFINRIRLLIDYRNTRNIRIPAHLAIVFNERQCIDCQLIDDIIYYSAIYGIAQLSLYDPWSTIKNTVTNDYIQQQLDKRIDRKLKVIVQIRQCDDATIVDNDDVPIMYINLLDANDGRQSLVNVACQLCTDNCNMVTVETIDQLMSIDEPDLLIKLGGVDSLLGYPPWTLRITEMIMINDNNNHISESQFVNYLEQYANRIQRFGR